MKKVFIILLAFVLLLASSVYVNAETSKLPENNKLLSDEWVKGLGKSTVTKEKIDGDQVYTISNIDTNFSSAYLDIYPSIKALMGNESEVSVYIVLDVRVVNTKENAGAEFPFGMKLRPACTELTKSQDAFNENYASESDTFKHQWGSVNASMISGQIATEEWQRIELYKTFVDVDINDEFWTKWNLCFDGMSDFENGASLQVKNAGIFLEGDYESDDNGDDDVNVPSGPESADGNKLLSNVWTKGLGKATAVKETVDGEEVYTMSNMDSNYASAYLDIYPSIKALMKGETEVSVYIVFDVRVVNTNDNAGEEFPFGMKLRPACTGLIQGEEAFNDKYASESDTFKYQYGSVNMGMISGQSATEEWQRIEINKTFIDFDVNDKFWTKWNLCFDQMESFANGASLQIKNVGIFLEDDYEPEEKEDGEEDKEDKYITPVTPPPAKINKPYYFDKYSVSFVAKDDLIDSTDNIGNNQNGNGNMQTVIIAGASVLLVAVVTCVVVVIVKKNKKKGSEQ